MSDLRSIIQNPSGQGFQNEYTCMGKVNGKKQLAADCRRLNIRVSSQALQAIEKGFSHKSRATYANIDQGHTLVWGNDEKSINTIQHKEDKEKKAEEKRAVEEDAKIRIAEEKKKKEVELVKAKKQKKREKEKKKMANLDSWEDIRV